MDNITVSKFSKPVIKKTYIGNLISRILISIIFILSSLIFTNLNNNNYKLYKDKVLNNNVRYFKYKKLYEKIFGKVLPNQTNSDVAVFNDSNKPYLKIEKYNDGEKLIYNEPTNIESIQSGIVVYIGNKENLGNTIIIQGVDDTDIWYTNINNSNLKLYDYVEKNKVIGEVDKELIIKIIKDNKNISYEEYIKTI